MTTTRLGGFHPPSTVWGRELRRYCDDAENDRCTLVPAHSYDRESGYVNAVGFLTIDSAFTNLSTFSALGEARFSELGDEIEASLVLADPSEGAATVSAVEVSSPPSP